MALFTASRRGWEIPESQATPEAVFRNRRALCRALAAGCVAAALPGPLRVEKALASGAPYGAAQAGRPLTPEADALSYVNFYEFGTGKDVAGPAARLKTDPWQLRIEGLVDHPETVDVHDLIRQMPLEQRVYRHRCVEAWAMTVPWTGFPLRALLSRARPQASARYMMLETAMIPGVMPGLEAFWFPWPYQEGLTLTEAANELAFMATGLYGKPLAPQNGAPLRLVLPWKYGFKSVKSITRISFMAERPQSFWERANPREYGFWANVNPQVPHPRWSQATERLLGSGERVPTQIYNGYGDQVAGLYQGMAREALFR